MEDITKKYRKYYLLFIFMSACTQNPADVVHKGNFSPNYSDNYVESPDGKIARNLRGSSANDNSSIIKDDIRDEEMNKVNKSGKIHIVKGGESLWGIAKKYNLTISELAEKNNLKKPYIVKIGDKLAVGDDDVATTKMSPSKSTLSTYKVKSGDNLGSIASKFNMKQDELIKLNNLKKPYKIFVGQNLKIKKSDGGNEVVITKREEPKKEPIKYVPTTAPTSNNIDTSNKDNIFMWPLKGSVISSFGSKTNGLYNDGINISATRGANFVATEDGTVAYVGNELRGYGTIILVKHRKNWISAYAHCDSVNVKRGDRVQKGQVIGTVGQTGNVSSPQLYFSLRNGRDAVDPKKYLK